MSAYGVYLAVLLGLLVMWHLAHFYFGHRLIHWKPIYRSAHYLHHKRGIAGTGGTKSELGV